MNFEYRFEELPDLWEGDFRSGSHNGTAEIHVNLDGSWVVKSISLDCHNGKCGPLAEGKSIELSQAYQGAMFDALCDSLEHFFGPHIEDRIAEMAAGEPSRMTLQAAE